MAAILNEIRSAVTASPSINDALSGIFGSVSITAWICLLIPQLITNYKARSADGLSMGFLFIWLFGDVTNLAGALITQLPPTAIAIAFYFCIADVTLIAQCLYYKYRSSRRDNASRRRRRLSSQATAVTDASEEDEPLLARRRSSSFGTSTTTTIVSAPTHDNKGLPGSHIRHESRSESSNLDPLTRMITGEDETPDDNPWLHNALSLLAVWAIGAAGWFLSYKSGAWDAAAPIEDGDAPRTTELWQNVGMGLGYLSAVLYLLARLPQIYKNWKDKSCDGLALLFFLLSFTGNATYGASLFAYSQESEYLLKALPWLLGSLGTIAEDGVIFLQFRLYAAKPGVTKVISNDSSEHAAEDGQA